MKTSKHKAANASSKINHMTTFPLLPKRTRAGCWVQAGLILGMITACGISPQQTPAPIEDRNPSVSTEPTRPRVEPLSTPEAPVNPPAVPATSRLPARWVPAVWDDLPGWASDRSEQFWPAFERSCARATAVWAALCAEASRVSRRDGGSTRQWLQQHLRPYRVESADGLVPGLITGYFEPLIEAHRQASSSMRVPLHMPPADLASRRPYWSRQQLETEPLAQARLRGREIAYVADPLDALLLQIQGSGRLRITEPNGQSRLVRLAFAGHNDQPYQSVGRWLIERGELLPGQASWPAIKSWATRNPQRVNELLWVNPRVVFFKEEPLPDSTVGPRGAQGVALTPGRSIAVDPQTMPYGTPVWLDTTEPLSNTPLRRLVVAQDTGSAIVGAVRADYFWGWGADAEAQAGRMKQGLRYWVLWPKNAAIPGLR